MTTAMEYGFYIFLGLAILGWRLRKDNAKRNELLEKISRQNTVKTSLNAKHKLKLKPKKLAKLVLKPSYRTVRFK